MSEAEGEVDQLDIVLKTIAAGKAAAIAAVNAFLAVETLLGGDKPAPEPEPVIDLHADHGEKVEFSTMGGRYLLCPCGTQWEASTPA